jgi:hypothetical protein
VSGDPITVEKKYKDPFELRNKAKLIFNCNEIPRISNSDDELIIQIRYDCLKVIAIFVTGYVWDITG